MRYITIGSAFILIFAAGMLIPAKRAAASQSPDFVEWALHQGNICDSTWDRITVEKTPGTPGLKCDFTSSRDASPMRRLTSSHKKSGMNWNLSKSGFIHKSNPTLLPLSTRERSGPTRGTGALRNPARARLATGSKFRRIPNPRMSKKHFFEERGGKWRIRVKSTNRIGGTWRSRGGISRPAFRADRPKRTRR